MMRDAALWLDGRTPRERWLLAVMAALGLIWLVYAALWQPLTTQRALLADRIARQDRAIALLNSAPAVAAPVTDSRPLNVIVTESAAPFQLVIRRLEPEGARLRLVLEDAPFETLILWLDAVEREHGLALTTLDLQRRPAPGVVSASLTLERPGS